MSKDEFILHEWQKDKFDVLVKYNEIEDVKKEGMILGKAEVTKKKIFEIARTLFNMKNEYRRYFKGNWSNRR